MNIIEQLKQGLIKHPDQGYALYLYNNGVEYNEVHGKVEDEASDDITFDSCFRLASVSKQFVAYAIVNLIKEGKLSYDTTIKSLYNELPDYFNNITITNKISSRFLSNGFHCSKIPLQVSLIKASSVCLNGFKLTSNVIALNIFLSLCDNNQTNTA